MKITLRYKLQIFLPMFLTLIFVSKGLPQHRSTGILGGVKNISKTALAKMQLGSYILHARDGYLNKISVEKTLLPQDPKGRPQAANIIKTAEDILYVIQPTTVSISSNGGLSWKSHSVPALEGHWQVLNNGTFIRVDVLLKDDKGPARVFQSSDHGRSWKLLSTIPIQVPKNYSERFSVYFGLKKLSDDTLFYGMEVRDIQFEGEPQKSAIKSRTTRLELYRSNYGGKKWTGPIPVCQWCSEGGIARLPSGKLFATIRYQRGRLPSDPPNILDSPDGEKIPPPYQHLFSIESQDDGLTWKNHRQLTTVFGQCYGYPAVQSDGTVVVVHDTRSGPLPNAARAMISYDAGKHWEDEAYYLFYGKGTTGYSQSVTLSDDTIVTVGGFSDYTDNDRNSPPNWTGNSRLIVIRWKPNK